MLTYDVFMSCRYATYCKLHGYIIISHVDTIMLHVDMNIFDVDIKKSHVDRIYLACRGKKYATIGNNLNIDYCTF